MYINMNIFLFSDQSTWTRATPPPPIVIITTLTRTWTFWWMQHNQNLPTVSPVSWRGLRYPAPARCRKWKEFTYKNGWWVRCECDGNTEWSEFKLWRSLSRKNSSCSRETEEKCHNLDSGICIDASPRPGFWCAWLHTTRHTELVLFFILMPS